MPRSRKLSWPTLDIYTVQLFWPYSYKGYSLEMATNMNGSWTSSEATPSLQRGQNSVVVPVDREQQFFRLKGN